MVWDPSGTRFYVSSGSDDLVYVYKLVGGLFMPDPPFVVMHTPAQLANTPAGRQMSALGYASKPAVSGLAVNRSGSLLYVTEYLNNQVAKVDTATRKVTSRITFFTPGGRTPEGERVSTLDCRKTAYGSSLGKIFVTSQRDGQVVVFDQTGRVRYIKVGSEPNRMVLSADGSRLYVANGDGDSISVIDTNLEQVVDTISLLRPGFPYKGASSNSLPLSSHRQRIYATLGGGNGIAVISTASNQVLGRIPTSWYPNSVSVSADRKTLYVVNAKDMPGPNPTNKSHAPNPRFRSEYIYALEKAGLLSIPVPGAPELQRLSQIVDTNNGFKTSHDSEIVEFLKTKIKHIIYIIKENRSYDEILGDLPVGHGDPSLALVPQAVTPNHNRLAQEFLTMDRFFVTSEVSGDGWNWTSGSLLRSTEEDKELPFSQQLTMIG